MLPTENSYGEWPHSGEIDIMEYLGHAPDKVQGTLHYSPSIRIPFLQSKFTGKSYTLDESDFRNEFHTFGLEWRENEIKWFVDGKHYQTQTDWRSKTAPYPAPFNRKFHLIINLAVGGLLPGAPDNETEFQSGDGCTLKGWTYRTPGQSNARGTCFMMHGFCDNSSSLAEGAKHISQKYNVTVIGFDHRYHGWSDKTPHYPTFGRHEAYDVEAAMDYADRNNYPKPYILHGISLGGLAAQRAAIEDRRVTGAFLLSVPATPCHAIKSRLNFIKPVAKLINEAYGWDVLGSGSLHAHQQDQDHRPLICYVMGDNDSYGIEQSKEIFNYWHNWEPGCENAMPSENRQCRKFFQTVYGAIHPDKPGYCVWDWEGYGPLENDFFETLLS